MKAAWYERNGPAREVMQTGLLPDPAPQPGEVRVAIAVSGCNPSHRTGDVTARVRALTRGAGVDHIVEVDFGANIQVSAKILKPNGTLAAYASSAVPEPAIPYYPLMMNGIGMDPAQAPGDRHQILSG